MSRRTPGQSVLPTAVPSCDTLLGAEGLGEHSAPGTVHAQHR